jgi:hypothetical protein
MMNQSAYTHADAWLLQAILYASQDQRATLKDIIAMGDAINHAIFAPGELQQGLVRLLSGNWIARDDNNYLLTESAITKLTPLLHSGEPVLKVREQIAEIIGASPWSPEEPLPEFDPDLLPKLFSIKDFKRALKRYQKEFWKIYREIEKRDQSNG